MTYYINSCLKCKWYLQNKKCLAFREDIPDIIWNGVSNHKNATEGDNGYQYNYIGSRTTSEKGRDK